MSIWTVFLVSLGTALATGLGVLPVIGARVSESKSVAISGAMAAGCMLGASAALVHEGIQRSWSGTAAGVALGMFFILLTGVLLGQRREPHIGNLRGVRGMTALLMIGVMTVHSLTEGVALGVSFVGEDSLGFLIALAIAVHNIPEGVAISLTLVPHGVSPWQAAGWSVLSSLPQPLMAVPAYAAVRFFEPLLPAGLGFAAGAMCWMVFARLLPEAVQGGHRVVALAWFSLALAAMVALEVGLGL